MILRGIPIKELRWSGVERQDARLFLDLCGLLYPYHKHLRRSQHQLANKDLTRLIGFIQTARPLLGGVVVSRRDRDPGYAQLAERFPNLEQYGVFDGPRGLGQFIGMTWSKNMSVYTMNSPGFPTITYLH